MSNTLKFLLSDMMSLTAVDGRNSKYLIQTSAGPYVVRFRGADIGNLQFEWGMIVKGKDYDTRRSHKKVI